MARAEGAPPGRPLAAIGFMLGTAGLMALASLIAKALGRGAGGTGLHPLQISSARFLFALIAVSAVALWLRPTFERVPWRRHLARTTLGWIGVTCLFGAAALMPLAEATAISFLNPMIAMVLAIPLLGERVGPWRWSGAVIAFAGGLILIRPGTEAFQPAALIALGAALAFAFEGILVKLLSRTEPAMRILLVNNALGAAISLTAAAFVWTAPTALQWGLMAAVGISVIGAQACFIQAMKRADASYALPFFYTTLVFAALYDLAIFGDLPDGVAVAGMLIVFAGAGLIAWRDRRRAGLG